MAKAKKEKSIEEALWESANKLRGAVEPSEYKHVVLSLIFLKFVSDKFEERREELKNEGKEKYIEMTEFYTIKNVFYLPEESRWSYIMANSKQSDIALKIDTALSTIEKKNPALKGALPDNYYSRLGMDVSKLASLLDEINNIPTTKDKEQDIIGRVYEFFLSKFAIAEGKGKGEFYTPKSIVNLIAEMIEPYKGKIYDPACGSGGMFVQSAKFIERHHGNINNISVFGQDSNPTTWKMAQMNLAIRGIEPDLGKFNADTFFDDQHPTLKADYILANPPFNLSDWGANKLQDDVRWKYGIPPAGNANFAWLQHMIHHLSPKGRIGMVLANGSLSSQTGGEGTIRENIIKADLIEGIIALPSQLFYTTGIPVSLWFLNRAKKQTNKILFVDARNMGSMITRKLRELSEEDIMKIAGTFDAFNSGTLENEKGYCAVVSIEDVAKQDYILTPGRYVGIAETHDLEKEIRKQLSSIGFTIK